jgi:hypothetical protein
MLTAGISEKESSDFYTCKPADNETDWSRTYFDFASAFLRRYNIVWTWLGINYFAFGKKDTDILAIVPYDLQAKIKDIITEFNYAQFCRYQWRIYNTLSKIKVSYLSPKHRTRSRIHHGLDKRVVKLLQRCPKIKATEVGKIFSVTGNAIRGTEAWKRHRRKTQKKAKK